MNKKPFLCVLSLLTLIPAISSCASTPEKGEKGDPGEQGSQGIQGEKGSDGCSVLTGTGVPDSSLGKDGDSYIDLSSYNYYVKENGSWEEKGNIKGADGLSIVETYINEDGHLICKMSDGTEIDAGKVKDVSKHTVNFYVDDAIAKTVSVSDGSLLEEPGKDDFPGYTVNSWSSKEDGGFRWLYSVYPVYKDIDLYADFEYKEFKVTLKESKFNLGEKTHTVTYKSAYDFSADYSKEGYAFTLARENGDAFLTSGTWSETSNITLNVVWEALEHSLTVASEDEASGSVGEVASKAKTDDSITVTATPKEGYCFDSWVDSSGAILSNDPTFTFTMPGHDYTLTAKFVTESENEEIIKYAKRPIWNEDKTRVTYGLYPQNHVKDETLVASLNALSDSSLDSQTGWYLYEGDYYAKVTAAPYEDATDYVYMDNSPIAKGSVDWFKVEPIEWGLVEDKSSSTYHLYSIYLLDHQKYDNDDGKNPYASSTLNTWLNGDFLNKAFALDSSYLQETSFVSYPIQDNLWEDRGSSGYGDTIKAKVYVESIVTYMNVAPFDDLSNRQGIQSDYLRALGEYSDPSNPYRAHYWSRSPVSGSEWHPYMVTRTGGKSFWDDAKHVHAIRPSVTLSLLK